MNMRTKLPYHPPLLREVGLNYKITFAMKKKLFFHNYNSHYQKINNVSMYVELTIKIFINLSLLILPFSVSHIRLQL